MGKVLVLAALAILCTVAHAAGHSLSEYVPTRARTLAPVLVAQQRDVWPAMPQPWTLAGLVEQESCVSLTNSRCWNPRAELHTSREYGFGLGQVTIAYRRDGSVRFNKFKELKSAHPSLGDWTWADRFNASEQLRAIALLCRGIWQRIPEADTPDAHLAFMLSGYNGGVSGVLRDKLLCSNTEHCDPGRWFGNVAQHSLKSKAPRPQYGGQSWFSINRGYVRKVMLIRRGKYKPFWDPDHGLRATK